MNDERYWPIYSLAQEMGLTIAFHTGHGYIYGANTNAGNPRHLEDVCRNFYDLKILAFHMGWPWSDDLNCIAGCYPNLHIGLSYINGMITSRPRFFAKLLGEAIMFAGIDKIIWSNDGIAQKTSVDNFRNFQFSEGLQADYGYKALTTEDKAKMFGLNFAKLIGIEPKKRCD
jgi:predicted TIM-barrel fold metal-dependent hydrolase